jgi:transcriptional regulator with XRE-family HTH domain
MYGVEQFDAEADDPDDAYSYATGDPDGEGRIEDVDGELRAYSEEPWDKLRWTFAPPVLVDEGFKLQPEWFFAFLHDPLPLRQQMRVRMPTFHYDDGEAEAIAGYFSAKAAVDHPAQYTRRLRLALGLEPEIERDGAPGYTQALSWPERALFGGGTGIGVEELASRTGLSADAVRAIERGSKPATAAGFARIQAYGDEVGFEASGPASSSFERVQRRSPSYLAAREGDVPAGAHPIALGREVAVRGPNCYQCHWHDGEAPDQQGSPIAWAPDLAHTRERLREDWTREWLWGPNLVYPGTSMPANFLADPPEYQAVWPDSDNAQQIGVVLDWLYNFERTPPAVGQSVDAR